MADRGFTVRLAGRAGAETAALARLLDAELQARGHKVEVSAGEDEQPDFPRDSTPLREGADVVRIQIVRQLPALREQLMPGQGATLEVHVVNAAEALEGPEAQEPQSSSDQSGAAAEASASRITLHTDGETAEASAARIIAALEEMRLVTRPEATGYTQEDEEEVRRRLEALGYV